MVGFLKKLSSLLQAHCFSDIFSIYFSIHDHWKFIYDLCINIVNWFLYKALVCLKKLVENIVIAVRIKEVTVIVIFSRVFSRWFSFEMFIIPLNYKCASYFHGIFQQKLKQKSLSYCLLWTVKSSVWMLNGPRLICFLMMILSNLFWSAVQTKAYMPTSLHVSLSSGLTADNPVDK